ncbi:deoxyuridine 5'-triphosphate nucleotidohydrolase [Chloroflexota bacterium]
MKSAAVLTKEDIRKLLQATPPLIENLIDIEQQLQPNGIDLTLKEIAMFSSPGCIGTQNASRVLSASSPLVFDGLSRLDLLPGPYLVTCNEVVNLPKNVMALAKPRSSLLRCGVSVHTAVWDAGYSGRSQSLIVVYNPQGFRILQNARFIQLVFFRLSQEVSEGYTGIFQGENV